MKRRLASGMKRAVTGMVTIVMGAVLALVSLVLFPACLWAASATLTWDAPTTNADGTPLTDLAGYKVYMGTASRQYSNPVDVRNVTAYTIQGLGEGTFYFAVTAYDTAGNESVHSNEVSKTIAVPPTAPMLRSSIIIIITP